MANIVSADELGTKGISRLDTITAFGEEAIISVRGKEPLRRSHYGTIQLAP